MLLGAPITSVSTFVSTSPDWLADQECRFIGHDDDGCVQRVRQRCDERRHDRSGGNGAIFLYWATPSGGTAPARTRRSSPTSSSTSSSTSSTSSSIMGDASATCARAARSGSIEGSPEMVGYRVAADRRLFPSYANVLASQISRAKQIGTPLSSLETRDDAQIPGVYSLFHVAVDHLVRSRQPAFPPLPRS